MTVVGLPPLSVVREHLKLGSPAVYPIQGVAATFDVDPSDHSLGIRVMDTGGSLPDVTGFEHLVSQRVRTDDRTWLELRVRGRHLIEDAHQLTFMIAQLLVEDRVSLASAVRTSLDRLQELLARRRGLSLPREVGLWGELHVLQELTKTLGPSQALETWRGPDGGEHDFTLDGDDLEVKTTTSERRQHHITHLTQLEPVPGRRLWLVSLQITRSTGAGARTLAEQVEETGRLLPGARAALERVLADTVGWPPPHDQWSDRWRVRSEPAIFPVYGAFPGLTRNALDAAGFDTARLISVEQLIDLTGWPEAAPTPLFWPQDPAMGRERA